MPPSPTVTYIALAIAVSMATPTCVPAACIAVAAWLEWIKYLGLGSTANYARLILAVKYAFAQSLDLF